jgi:hypothetical protein
MYLDDSNDVINNLKCLGENYISELNNKKAFMNPENLKVCYSLILKLRKL